VTLRDSSIFIRSNEIPWWGREYDRLNSGNDGK
jgi:hypothetical protein